MDIDNDIETVKITIDVTKKAAMLLAQEAKENKRSRKSQLEIAVEKHAERYERRTADNGN